MNEIEKNMPLQRLYTILDDVYHYRTGRLGNGNQALMLSGDDGTATAELTWAEFDSEGDLVAFYDKAPRPSSMSLLFTPGAISVKSFFIPEVWFGIQDLPEHYQEFLDHPENANEEERLYYPEEISAWHERGDFVLWCNEDYYLNKDGELESS